MYPEDIVIEPVLTEKTNALKEIQKYVFRISPRANKVQVKYAIKVLYNVEVLSCNIINVKGKKKKQGKFVGKTSLWKKAIVELKKGDTISIFEGV